MWMLSVFWQVGDNFLARHSERKGVGVFM